MHLPEGQIGAFEARRAAAAAGVPYDPDFLGLPRAEQAAIIAHYRASTWLAALEAHDARMRK